ncbi:MAG TPA: HGxxPAAW family protein [Spirillospora sp.]
MSTGSHAGRPKSWVAVSIILVGFIVGGVGLTRGPDWVVFGAGAALVVLGGIVALAVDIMSDVIVDEPRS